MKIMQLVTLATAVPIEKCLPSFRRKMAFFIRKVALLQLHQRFIFH